MIPWGIFQRLLHPLYQWFWHLRIPLTVVVMGDSIDMGIARTNLLTTQRWYRRKAGIIWQTVFFLTDDRIPEDSLRAYFASHDEHQFPTLYVLPKARLEGNALGRNYGGFLAVSKEANYSGYETFAHELGHSLLLRHQEQTFMAPHIGNTHITQSQIDTMRQEARIHAR